MVFCSEKILLPKFLFLFTEVFIAPQSPALLLWSSAIPTLTKRESLLFLDFYKLWLVPLKTLRLLLNFRTSPLGYSYWFLSFPNIKYILQIVSTPGRKWCAWSTGTHSGVHNLLFFVLGFSFSFSFPFALNINPILSKGKIMTLTYQAWGVQYSGLGTLIF